MLPCELLNVCKSDNIDQFPLLVNPCNIHQHNEEITRTVAHSGSIKILRYILQNYKIRIHAKNDDAFKGACLGPHKNLEVAKLLLQTYDCINVHIDDDYIHKEACSQGKLEVVKFLVELDPSLETYENFDAGYVLACSYGHFDIVEYLQQINPNLISKYYLDRLYGACKHNKVAMVKYLITDARYLNMEVEIGITNLFKLCAVHVDLELCNWFYDSHYFDDIDINVLRQTFRDNLNTDHPITSWILRKYDPEIDQNWYWTTDVLNLYNASYSAGRRISANLVNNAFKLSIDECNLHMCKVLYDRHSSLIDLYSVFVHKNYQLNKWYQHWRIIPDDKFELYHWLSDNDTKIRDRFNGDLIGTLNYYASKNNVEKIINIGSETGVAYNLDSILKTACSNGAIDVCHWVMRQYNTRYKMRDLAIWCKGSPDTFKTLLISYKTIATQDEVRELIVKQKLFDMILWVLAGMPQEITELFYEIIYFDGDYTAAKKIYDTYADKIKLTDSQTNYIIRKINSQHANIDDVLWIYLINPTFQEQLSQNRALTKSIQRVDEVKENKCIICKTLHKNILVLPCNHNICLDKLIELRVTTDIGSKCIACHQAYEFSNCKMYWGQSIYSAIFS